jgi:hypothetical protein
MLKKILLGVGALVVLIVVVVATRPSAYHVERQVEVAAPADVVFAEVNDLHNWAAWSPWEKIDPAMQRTFEGPAAGVGAAYSWSSTNPDAGKGKMTVLESLPGQRVAIELAFEEPFENVAQVTFTLAPAGTGSSVTWAMDGEHIFVGKAMCMFMDCDGYVGADFEKGLASLKTVAEGKQAAAVAAAAEAAAKTAAAPSGQ